MRAPLCALLVACADKGGDSATGVCADAPTLTWASHGQAILTQWCQPCHATSAANRHGAPESVAFDTEAEALAWGERILAVSTGDDPTMPPGMPLPEEDRYRLEIWLSCGEGL